MTERELFYISTQKLKVLSRDNWICQKCGRQGIFLAHRIAQTKSNIKKYGIKVIHNSLNLVTVCERQDCNDFFNIGNNDGKCQELVNKIKNNS